MASTFSPSLKLTLMGDGDQAGLWGQTTNTNLGTLVEQAITGVQSITMTDANYTLTNFNGITNEARNAVLVVTGTNNAVRDLIPPVVEKLYTIANNTTGGFAIRVIGVSGTGVSIPNGATCLVFCDGTNFVNGLSGAAGNFAVTGATTLSSTLGVTGATSLTTGSISGVMTAPTASAGTNTTQLATTAFVTAALSAIYPVGSIYINSAVSTNPATLLGFGTWEAFGAGRVMVGFDSSDALFDTLEETGGSKDSVVVSHTHTATSTDSGHTHTYVNGATNPDYKPDGASGPPAYLGGTGTTNSGNANITTTVASTGSSGTNANIQPYITVRMWKRTA